MQRRLRQVLTAIREYTVVHYAKIATAGGFCDLDLILVKATSPNNVPLPDKYIHQLLKIFSISPTSYRDFAFSFTRRFNKTQCWRVALKCLVLLHRLLRSLPDNTAFRKQLVWAREQGHLCLSPCYFRDCSSTSSVHYTDFIKSYAHLLNEALDCLSPYESKSRKQITFGEDKMRGLESMLDVLARFQNILDGVMDCRLSEVVATKRLVKSAMMFIIRESFIIYTNFKSEMVVILEHLIEMPYESCVTAFGIYKRASLQANELSEFYDWSKSMWFCGLYEYPFVDQIPRIQIHALESFLNGMWQLTDSSSSSDSSMASKLEYPMSLIHDKQIIITLPESNCANVESRKGLKKDEDYMKPLIELDVEEDVSWEVLLEASINASKKLLLPAVNDCGTAYSSGDGWEMQVYNPYCVNPFNQPHSMAAASYGGSYPINSTYPWGL